MTCCARLTTIILFYIFMTGCSAIISESSENNRLYDKTVNMNEQILHLKVKDYEDGGNMPYKFATKAGGGENISPRISWQTLPEAKSYAIMFYDKFPAANNWVHWLIADIPNTFTDIPEGASRTDKMPAGSRELITSWGRTGYDGPQPPVGSGNHEYVVTLYALDVNKLSVPENISRGDFLKTAEPHIIAQESYSGFFER